ncbi:GNAT family N-acetyltransferase [Stappia taiwanensis]|uniref:GNAT family N-acetyltransferase n=1 Tax=Stappia taiwanensis TaxID=992267 RepID=A0A838XSL7_9HYPH|nr:GNAT family N-acetyltransferase [Stappia taiwanensis]MBA4611536.1 GNAT family N-acetyltransferase [Stappia taiwanensis]GGE99490.1 molybdopterin-guanine dinucleotide biosynthesis protein MobC [Stappia taiwanensis]
MTLDILPFVRAGDETAATRLFTEALFQKLRPFFGREDSAVAFLTPHLCRERAVTALVDGRIAGIAGFRLDGRELFNPQWSDLQRHYGLLGASWRAAGLSLLEKDKEAGVLSMDGIAVSPEARGRGIGTALLDAICSIARQAGRHSVRLDVIDSNPRARALYERNGFVAGETRHLGLFKLLFGFSCATAMRRTVGPAAGHRPRTPTTGS